MNHSSGETYCSSTYYFPYHAHTHPGTLVEIDTAFACNKVQM